MNNLGWFFLLALPTSLAWARRQKRRTSFKQTADPVRSIAKLSSGRHRIRGQVRPLGQTIESQLDGAECVYIDHAEYRSLNRLALGTDPMLREVSRQLFAAPFLLDDGTGQVLLNPATMAIEATTQEEEMQVEHRIRVGEEMELVANFVRGDNALDMGPYRSIQQWQIDLETTVPQLSYRTLPNMIRQVDDMSAVLSGVSLLVLAGLLVFTILVGF